MFLCGHRICNLLFSHLSFTASHSKYTKQRSITTKTRSKISRFQVRNDQHVCVHLPQSVLCRLSSLLQTFLSFFSQYVCCAQKKLDSRSIMVRIGGSSKFLFIQEIMCLLLEKQKCLTKIRVKSTNPNQI